MAYVAAGLSSRPCYPAAGHGQVALREPVANYLRHSGRSLWRLPVALFILEMKELLHVA